MADDRSYAFTTPLSKDMKEKLQLQAQEKLTEILSVEVDTVMAEYVVVMVGNKKTMAQISHDLVDFIGDEYAEQFVQWLSGILPSLDAEQQEKEEETNASPPQETKEQGESTKSARVISLKGITSSSAEDSQSKGTIRTLNRSKDEDLKAVLAKRSQRFGVVKPSSSPTNPKSEGDVKRKMPPSSSERETHKKKSRVTQLLGPPVNVDQAELDARDSLNKRRKPRDERSSNSRRDRSRSRSRERSRGREDQENQDADNRKRQSDAKQEQPPLPPHESGRFGHGPRGPPGGFRGPPGYGGFPPHPYGPPMFYPPGPFGPPVPPYGYPPHHSMHHPPHHAHGGPRGPYPNGPPVHHAHGPRGAGRPSFQNKTWVNPNSVKKDDDASEKPANANGESTNTPSTFAPRNPYYNAQMRPRFQNKTWVRQDVEKDTELSTSLPKTPPQEELERVE